MHSQASLLPRVSVSPIIKRTCESEFIRQGDGTGTARYYERKQVGYQAASFAFDFDFRRPVKPRWPEADIDSQGKPAWMPV